MAEGEQPDESQKTEDPTPKRLEESRKKGQVALSREINNWAILCAGTLLIALAAGGVLSGLYEILSSYMLHANSAPGTIEGVGNVLVDATIRVFKVLWFPFLVLMAVAFLSPFLQIGPLFSAETLKPDLSKVSPIKGFGRLFSMRSLMEFAKGVLKIAVIGLVGFLILYPYYGQMEHLVGVPMSLLLVDLRVLVVKLMIGVLIALLIIAVIDLVYQRQEHHKKMRMTKQEVKDEYKQSEGDPHVKGRLRQLRQERARQRMMQAVPEADVVITNPTHFAIALKYKPGEMEAPVCIAKGVDQVAFRIREVAEEHKIVIVENKPLARALYDTVDIDEIVPPEHYKAVAEVISYVFKLRGQIK